MTMQVFKHTIVIDRPRDQVFDLFVDLGRTPHWRQYVTSLERLDSGPLEAGSRIRATMDLMGEATSYELEVLACERPSLWRHRSNETDFTGHIEYRFEPEGSGTRVTMSCVARPISLYGWLALPLMWLARGKSYKEQLPALKRAAEA